MYLTEEVLDSPGKQRSSHWFLILMIFCQCAQDASLLRIGAPSLLFVLTEAKFCLN